MYLPERPRQDPGALGPEEFSALIGKIRNEPVLTEVYFIAFSQSPCALRHVKVPKVPCFIIEFELE